MQACYVFLRQIWPDVLVEHQILSGSTLRSAAFAFAAVHSLHQRNLFAPELHRKSPDILCTKDYSVSLIWLQCYLYFNCYLLLVLYHFSMLDTIHRFCLPWAMAVSRNWASPSRMVFLRHAQLQQVIHAVCPWAECVFVTASGPALLHKLAQLVDLVHEEFPATTRKLWEKTVQSMSVSRF